MGEGDRENEGRNAGLGDEEVRREEGEVWGGGRRHREELGSKGVAEEGESGRGRRRRT